MQHYKPPGAVKKQENPPAPGPGGKDPNANSEDQKAGGGGGGGGGGGSNNFMTLRADCSDPYRVVVTLRTSEPFEGLLYREV